VKFDKKSPLERKSQKNLYLFLIFAGLIFVNWFMFEAVSYSLRPIFMSKEDRIRYERSLESAGGVIGYMTLKGLKPLGVLSKEEKSSVEEVEALSEKYPFPTPVNLLTGKCPVNTASVSVSLLMVLLSVGTALGVVFLDKKVLVPFFYRKPAKDPALEMGNDYPLDVVEATGVPFSYIESLFEEGGLDEILRVADARIPKKNSDDPYGVIRVDNEKDEIKFKEEGRIVFNRKKAQERVRAGLEELLDYGKRLGLVRDGEEKLFRASLGLALIHHVLDYFGGIPVGFMTPRIKDYTLKRVLASYGYRNKVPLTKFNGVSYEEEEVPARFLTSLHGFCREKKDLYLYLEDEFCQIPGWDELVPIKRQG